MHTPKKDIYIDLDLDFGLGDEGDEEEAKNGSAGLSRTDWLYRCARRYHEYWRYPLVASSRLAQILLVERGGEWSDTPEEDVDLDIERTQNDRYSSITGLRKLTPND